MAGGDPDRLFNSLEAQPANPAGTHLKEDGETARLGLDHMASNRSETLRKLVVWTSLLLTIGFNGH